MELYEELERKFLVLDLECIGEGEGTHLAQGYLFPNDTWSIRIRVTDDAADDGVLTIKQRRPGVSRAEFESQLPRDLALQLLQDTPYRIEKTRHPLVAN